MTGKSKVFAVAVECWSGGSPTAVFYRRGPGRPYPDWMQPHDIRTASSAKRLERLMEGGRPHIVNPRKHPDGSHLPGFISIFKETDPKFWAEHDRAIRAYGMTEAA